MTIGVSKFDPVSPAVPDDFSTIPAGANNVVDLLNGALSADNFGNVPGQMVISLFNAANFPVNGGWVTIGSEIVSYAVRAGNNLVGVVRGAQGTQIKAHAARSAVALNFTAAWINVLAQGLFNAQQAIISFIPTEQFDIGATDGSATITLTKTPKTGVKVKLFINGAFYTDGTGTALGDFTRAGTVLTFRSAPYPPAGNSYTALYPA